MEGAAFLSGSQVRLCSYSVICYGKYFTSELNKIDNEVERNSQYVSKRQILIAKIIDLWKHHEKNNPKAKEKLSDDEIKTIKFEP